MVPSPKFHEYEAMVPSGSSDPDDEKVIVWPDTTPVGAAPATATGGVLVVLACPTVPVSVYWPMLAYEE